MELKRKKTKMRRLGARHHKLSSLSCSLWHEEGELGTWRPFPQDMKPEPLGQALGARARLS